MTPDFALSLSFDGLRLLMRDDAGWLLVGEVALDARDMRAGLADLRHRGERLAGGPFEAKLLIPNEQIRYLSLDGTMTTEEQVRAALDGATPYPVADLVYDYTKGGGRTYIAAVARETLTEAEAFAREHGITPVSFAAVPDPFTFVGEVVFGPVSTEAGREVVRDPDPVRIVGTAHLPGAVASSAVSTKDAEDADGLAPGAAVEADEPARESVAPRISAGRSAEDAVLEDDTAAEPPSASEKSHGRTGPQATEAPIPSAASSLEGSADALDDRHGPTPVAGEEARLPGAATDATAGAEPDIPPEPSASGRPDVEGAGPAPQPSGGDAPKEPGTDAGDPAFPLSSDAGPPVASEADNALSPGAARDTAETPENGLFPADPPTAKDAPTPVPVFSSRRATAQARPSGLPDDPQAAAPSAGSDGTDLGARGSMPVGAGPDDPPRAEAVPVPGTASPKTPSPQPPDARPKAEAREPHDGIPVPSRPAIFSRAARTPQLPRPNPGPVARTGAAKAETRPGEPPPPRPIAAPPAPATTPAGLRIERAPPARSTPAFLDGLASKDEVTPQRPTWRETLAQRMRGKSADEPAFDETAVAEKAKPAGKRLPLAFATARGAEPSPGAPPRVAARPETVTATPGAAPVLTARRSAPAGAATPVPRPDAADPTVAKSVSAGPAPAPKAGRPASGPQSGPQSGPTELASETPPIITAAPALAAARPTPLIGAATAVSPPRPADGGRGATPAAETPTGAPPTSGKPRILRRPRTTDGDKAAAATGSGTEKTRMTVFGARRTEETRAVGGKPRYLGLLLTVILLAAMAVVAAMAGAPEALSRLFDPREATTQIATSPAPAGSRGLSAGAPPIPVPAAPGVPISRPQDAIAAASGEPVTEPAPEPQAPDVVDRAPEALPLQTEPVETAPPAIAPEPAAPRIAAVPLGRVLSPTEAQRIYAATGVWQRAPRIPVAPRLEASAGVATPAPDNPGRPPVPGRPIELAQALTDVRIPTPADPPPPGTGFERDARGFILATPEGTLTPDGILVYAGAPPILPALRPGTTPPPASPAAAVPGDTVAELSEGAPLVAGEPGLEPPLRAGDITPEAGLAPAASLSEAGTTAAVTAAGIRSGDDRNVIEVPPPGLAFLQTPGIVPPVRPATVTARAVESNGAETEPTPVATAALASEIATDTISASRAPVRFLSSRTINPPARPADRAPAPSAEAAPVPAAASALSVTAVTDTPEAGTQTSSPAGVAFIETRAIRPPSRPADLAPASSAPEAGSAPATAPLQPTDISAPARASTANDVVVFVSTRAIRPPARPGSRAPVAAETVAPPAAPSEERAADPPAVLVRTAAVTPPVRSAEVVARAAVRVEAERAAIAERAASVQVVDVTPGGVSLAALDPPLRPESILASARTSVPPPATETATGTSLRPRVRPGDLAPGTELAAADEAADEASDAEAAEAAAEAVARRNAELLAAAAAAADALGASVPGLATATPRAVASSIRPDARPRNMATLVQRARQQQQRDQARAAPAAAPAPAAAAAAAPAAAAPQSTAATRVQPSGQTSTTVAAAATIDRAINLNRINLIGVYGRLDDRRALVRLPGNRYVRLAVGDSLDGGRVSSIGDGFITYAKSGRNVRLDLPG